MDHQDLKPVVLKKELTKKEAIKKGYATPEKKIASGKNKQNKVDNSLAKLDKTELPQLTTITHELAKQIQKARTDKKLNQDELAKKSQVPLATLKNYENPNSKVVVQSDVLNKLSRVLGVQLKKPALPKIPEVDESGFDK
jgi:ribosome-binding protein aMBF1 (putative translation factor)